VPETLWRRTPSLDNNLAKAVPKKVIHKFCTRLEKMWTVGGLSFLNSLSIERMEAME
jgi:hypothetical protein